MSTEDEIKRNMIQQMMGNTQNQHQQMEDALKDVIGKVLDKRARERLHNLKVIKPDLALQLQMYLVQLYQTGQIPGKITDEQLVMILKNISKTKDIKITRK